MRILKATPNNILLASQIIRNGGLVVYPTDTVYGLGCDPFNNKAVNKIFKVKDRKKKPLPVLISEIESVEKIAYLTGKSREIARKVWPGPFTLIVPKKDVLPNFVTGNLKSVGLRLPNHDVATQLINLSNGYLIGTSANKTGEKSPKNPIDAAEQIGKEVDLILDGGLTVFGKSSAVIDLTTNKTVVLREGPIKLEEAL
jgi:L-threonylcarbamoyladenylate synthase